MHSFLEIDCQRPVLGKREIKTTIVVPPMQFFDGFLMESHRQNNKCQGEQWSSLLFGLAIEFERESPHKCGTQSRVLNQFSFCC
ncbi:MAG: hypothetical protein EBS05_04030 [Proteobacteria bacterium]|nr:hypothetical protein [Pseudomonadota bacterium]